MLITMIVAAYLDLFAVLGITTTTPFPLSPQKAVTCGCTEYRVVSEEQLRLRELTKSSWITLRTVVGGGGLRGVGAYYYKY